MNSPNAEQIVEDAIVSFNWSNYGLDEVDEADTEYASHLAKRIVKALSANTTQSDAG